MIELPAAAGARLAGPVWPGGHAVRLQPLPMASVRLGDTGWWGQWQSRNRAVTLPYGVAALEVEGNLDNFRRLLAGSDAAFRGLVFNDSDLYKTLEAAAWALSYDHDDQLDAYIDSAAALLKSVQAGDGYLNTYVQGEPSIERYSNLAESHELYCAGHLFQAAIADFRATGKVRLLEIAVAFADHLVAEFGGNRRRDYDGHPEVESALVELFRTCGDRRYLDLAKQFIDSRGQRIFTADKRGHAYFQDGVPIREARSIVGHAVRALYLEAGVVDVATETGDVELLRSSLTRWQDMVATKLYITGGVGSRHKSESFGDPYELPPDRAYCETCAAIASVHWNWRLLLATGESRFADLIERTVYNGFAASTGLDGTSFFYSNPLQVRAEHEASSEEESGQRLAWYACACCPPNVMRFGAALNHYIATTDAGGVQLHQFTDADLDLRDGVAGAAISMRTRYPWDGAVEIKIVACEQDRWTLSLRQPAWCSQARLAVNGADVAAASRDGYLSIERSWHAGDIVTLDLTMEPRVMMADLRVDAVRGCVAIERGPLVYCVEMADNPAADLAAIRLHADGLEVIRHSEWPEVQAIRAQATAPTARADDESLYMLASPGEVIETQVAIVAVPYYLWGNRAPGAMRVWLPGTFS